MFLRWDNFRGRDLNIGYKSDTRHFVLPGTARCRSRASSPKSAGDAAAPCVVCETSHFFMEFQDTLRRLSLKLGTFGAFGFFEAFEAFELEFHLHGHGIPRAGDGVLTP